MNFDPQAYLDATLVEPTTSKREPIPAGEYSAVAGAPAFRGGEVSPEGQQKMRDKGRPVKTHWLCLDIPWEIEDSSVKAKMGIDVVTVRQSLMLDIDEDLKIDNGKGKNIRLGRLREALLLNDGQFNPRMIQGRRAIIRVKQRPEGEEIYNDVDGVAPLS